jgi:hypothetical protein
LKRSIEAQRREVNNVIIIVAGWFTWTFRRRKKTFLCNLSKRSLSKSKSVLNVKS